jgi:transcription-repair coupling factor (superfamily II helicase)
VAILVPTTILAEQHYYNFSQRLKDFPVNIQMLSRFKTFHEQKEIVDGLTRGTVDIVVGTHRLLSEDIKFKDLGLVIIDEEQRFGVKAKERLKHLRLLVDVLTLTATPIPRTLYMSMMGARDLSVINTPPENRLAVATQVAEYDEDLIKQAVLRELNRQGQVYFVHNRVEDIDKIATHLEKSVKQGRFGLAHGQMPAHQLEEVMVKFLEGKVDILVCTTIVESGIDVPNANTLIVNNADNFGLSDLHQLRGRVGRFTQKAYAYFLIPKGKPLSNEAQRRIKAIEQYSELGAGFKIAYEDLQIRGAGNLLGEQQHGYIAAVGFDLYCRLLKEAVSKIQSLQKSRRLYG